MEVKRLSITTQTIQRLLRRDASSRVKKLVAKLHPTDIAIIFNYLRSEECLTVFQSLDNKARKADVLCELQPNIISDLLEQLSNDEIGSVLSELPSDDAAEILGNLDDERSEQILKVMKTEHSGVVQELLTYEEETAGRIMIQSFFALPETTLVKDAIQKLQEAEDAEMVFYVYVYDDNERLSGVVSLRRLLLVPPTTPLTTIITRDIVTVRPYDDQEDVARLVAKYNLLAIPVVDQNQKMLGIVTVDDVIDVIKEEATADIYRMAGSGQDQVTIDSPWETFKVRAPWLLVRTLGGLATAVIISRFTSIEPVVFMMAALLPVILGTGTTTGTQTAITIARGLSMGVLGGRISQKVLLRELSTATVTSIVFGSLVGLGAGFLFMNPRFGLFTGVSIILVVFISSMVGSFIPLILKRLHFDPSTATIPFVSSILDLILVAVYLTVAGFLVAHHYFPS